jgi:CubicO group peptidase (beta-lactamase class C family)
MSVWKSILSVVLGICLDKKLIVSVDEPIHRFLPPFAQNTDPFHKMITVRHLLTMSSGIFYNPGPNYSGPMLEQLFRSKDHVSHIADVQVKHTPGTYFKYKEWDAHLLSAIVSRVCGKTVDEVFEEFIYTPLAINNASWKNAKCGVCSPKCTCNVMPVVELAKVGRLMLNGGIWDGRRILSEEYIKMSTALSETNGGYGFLWWKSGMGYHGRGYGGQELNIYPAHNMVAVVQATATPRAKGYGDICENITGSNSK